MKKLFAGLIIVALITAFAACAGTPNGKIADKVSYYDTGLYTGESADFAVTLTKGVKEVSLIADGTVGVLADFTTVRMVPLHTDLFNNQYTYTLTGEGGQLTGTLVKDMFGASFSAEIENIASIGVIMNIAITSAKVNERVELTDRLKDMLTWEDILAIGADEFADQITAETDADSFNREIHIKYINNRNDRTSPYYWYIAFINSKTNYWALLIDPDTGEIVSKKS